MKRRKKEIHSDLPYKTLKPWKRQPLENKTIQDEVCRLPCPEVRQRAVYYACQKHKQEWKTLQFRRGELLRMFDWRLTSEGFEYWAMMNRHCRRIENIQLRFQKEKA